MKSSYNLLEKYEWLGEFWIPKTDNKMPGILSYSPKDGIKLKLLGRYHRVKPVVKDEDIKTLFGYTFETGPLTIFSPKISNVGFSGGGTFIDEVHCGFIVIGKNFEDDEVFDKCDFRLNNFNEFCYPKSHALYAPTIDKDGLVMRCDSFTTQVHQDLYNHLFYWDTSEVFPEHPTPTLDVSKIFVITDEDLKKDLNTAFIEVLTKHNKEKEALNVKEDIRYRISISSTEQQLASIWFEKIHIFGMLISCFMLKGIIPIEINFLKRTDNKFTRHQVLKSPYLNDSQVKKAQEDKDINYWMMLVNLSEVKNDFTKIIESWEKFVNWKFNIVHDTIFGHLNAGDGSYLQKYVLLMASVSQFYSKLKDNKSGENYDWFFNTYAGDKIQNEFLKLLPEGIKKDNIGEALGDIRNSIMHPVKLNHLSEQWSVCMKPVNIYNISELIFLTLIIALYSQIGISKAIIQKLQDNFDQYIVTHSEF